MKRIQLIRIALIATALICGYKSLESLVAVVIALIYQFEYRYDSPVFLIFQYILLPGIYFGAVFLVIKFNKQIASYIDKHGQTTASPDTETINIAVEHKGLLYTVLITLCLATLIAEIPTIILSIYKYFKREVGGVPFGSATDIDFKSPAIKFVFTLIILFDAKSISAWFSKQISQGKPVIETNNES
jgi:hypothetical protein